MRRAAGMILLAMLIAAGAAPAQAPVLPGLDNDRAALITAKQAAADAEARAAALDQAAAAAGDAAERARAQAASLTLQVKAAEADIVAARARIGIVAALVARQRARIAVKREPILRLTAALQTMARRPAALAIAQPGSVDDIVHVRLLLADMLPVIAARTASLRVELDRANALHDDAERAAASLDQGRLLLASRRQALAVVEASAIRRSQRLAEQAADEAQRALGLGEEARDAADRLQTRQTAEDIRAQLARLAGPDPRPAGADDAIPPLKGRPAYLLPAHGAVTSGFGDVSDSGVTARGLTLTTGQRAEVIAPHDGRIGYAGPFRSYGRVVIILHGGGWTTTVTGLDSLSVKVGDRVRQGQAIGRAGDGVPAVTVELRRASRPVDVLAMAQAG
ncbi:MAG TPA: peptidoglycan DD-metalloendopeptidase family protein [Sphingomonas sp.]